MNQDQIREACLSLGMVEPISIEPDGTVWTGANPDRVYADMKVVLAEVKRLNDVLKTARETALGKLSALGLTDLEIKALLG